MQIYCAVTARLEGGVTEAGSLAQLDLRSAQEVAGGARTVHLTYWISLLRGYLYTQKQPSCQQFPCQVGAGGSAGV